MIEEGNRMHNNTESDHEVNFDTFERLPGWKGRLQLINERIMTIERMALYICLFVMCLGAFLEWFLRVFFTIGFAWMGELTMYAMLWAGFLGAVLATSRLEHFRIDLVRLIKDKNRIITRVFRIASYLTALILCIVFAYASLQYINTLIQNDLRSSYGYAIWPFFIIVLYFYIASGVRFLFTALMKLL